MTRKDDMEDQVAVERRPRQILERRDMAEESTIHGYLETACCGLPPTTGHNGCLMMMMMMMMILWYIVSNAFDRSRNALGVLCLFSIACVM